MKAQHASRAKMSVMSTIATCTLILFLFIWWRSQSTPVRHKQIALPSNELIMMPSLAEPLPSHLSGSEIVDDHLFRPNFDDENLNAEYIDLRLDVQATSTGWQNQERVIFLVPLRDAAPHLPMFFSHLGNMTYPHHLIDLAFLVSDSKDNTLGVLEDHLLELQNSPDRDIPFGNIEIFEKDFGQAVGQGFSDRHGFAAQGPRRKNMARARNWLTAVALKPYHSWVYWRDVDVETIPPTILEDLMNHNKDIIVPNVWRPLPDWLGGQQPYDLNSWQESDGGIQLAKMLDEDAVIVEGYPEFNTWRPHLAYLRDPYGDPTTELQLDGIGGVSILAKASVFRYGAHFPAFSFMKHAETEGLGKLARAMGLEVVGLPHYVIWHIYEPSDDDLKHMEWMRQEEIKHANRKKMMENYNVAFKHGFQQLEDAWNDEKHRMMKNSDPLQLSRDVEVDWSE